MNEQLTIFLPPDSEVYYCFTCGKFCGTEHPVRVFSPFHLGKTYYKCNKCAKEKRWLGK